ncbi:hypothetical protein KFU94_39850 [Chloroflexi bacterium TSY]|nr:hypothetical protein [Chloroflexi bacterium TSY]
MMPILLLIALLWLLIVGWLYRLERTERSAPLSYLDGIASGLLWILTVGFFWRVLSGDVFQPADGGDLVSFLFPTYRFAASQISQWTLPLWNPHLYGGAPFIGDIQAGFLYPPNFLLFLIWPDFDYVTLQWLAQLHIYWAGLGTYVLLRSLDWGGWKPSRPAAFFAAIAFSFSDPLLIHLGNLNLIAVLSWMPWVLAAYTQALQRSSLRWAAGAALLFAIGNYAGHAQSSVYIGLALVVYGLIWGLGAGVGRLEISDWRWGDWGLGRHRDREGRALETNASEGIGRLLFALRYGVVVFVLAFLLTAPILLPTVELAGWTERSDFSYQDTIAFSLAPTQAIGLLTPGFFGRGPALHWSLWDRVETPYAGIPTVILAVGALILVRPQRRYHLWPWVGVALFGFVTALGVYSILHGWLTILIPSFDQFRAPARALVLWTLGLSVLAAAGLDLAVQKISPFAPAATTAESEFRDSQSLFATFLKGGSVLLLFVAVPLVYMTLLLTQADETTFLRSSVAALAITIAAFFWLLTCGVLTAYRAGWFKATPFALLLIGVLYFELSSGGGAYLDISPRDPTRGFDHPEIVAFLKNDPDRYRIDTRTGIEQYWQPDAAALHGLQDVWGIANPLLLMHWSRLWESTGGRHTPRYDLLNVKYVLVQDDVLLPEGKFERVLDAPGELSLYQNRTFWPRAWVVHTAKSAPDEETAWSMFKDGGFDPLRMIVVHDGAEGLETPSDAGGTRCNCGDDEL